ncbi:hypothetical protein BC629DRAFT_1246756, partial [Irpex lacteus]
CTCCNECPCNHAVKDGTCACCRTDKCGPVRKFSCDNKAAPGDHYPCLRPLCLQNLTEVEEMLITRVQPMMQVWYPKG